MKRLHLLALSILSGLLLSAAWPAIGGISALLLLALVPLLAVEQHYLSKWLANQGLDADQPQRKLRVGWKVFGYSYLAFVIWTGCTNWWLYEVNEPTAIKLIAAAPAVLVNALFFATVFVLGFHLRRSLGPTRGYIGMVILWLGFEYTHHHWELSYPWLSLGNGFGNSPWLVQWYEYTGIEGGSLWIWATNILIFSAIRQFSNKPAFRKALIGAVAAITIPTAISVLIENTYENKGRPYEVVVVQPNVDPYTEKFVAGETPESTEAMLLKMLEQAASVATPETDFFVFPETAIPRTIDVAEVEQSRFYPLLRTFLADYPKARIVIGTSCIEYYDSQATKTARQTRRPDVWYDWYNSAWEIEASGSYEFYHKSKLVLGVEKVPFADLLGGLSIDLGGTSGQLGVQEERPAFASTDEPGEARVAPVICYESVYGEFVGDCVNNGAELIFVITNDAWWDHSPGYKQHLTYSRLRAIEHRRSVARSANTGTSCFIDQLGNISQATEFWEPAAIKGTILANNETTFYTRFGDYISRTAVFFSVLLLLWGFVKIRFKNKSLV